VSVFFRILASVSVVFALSAAAPPTSCHAEIVRFMELEPGKLFRGGQPETLDDYLKLEAHGIRTIINMKTSEVEIEIERQLAEAFGMKMISRPINSFWGPTDKTVSEIQSMMMDPSLQPVFIHCRHGKDRTGLMAGVYRVEQQGWTPGAAHTEMRSLGFNPWLLGLRHRFWDRVSDHSGFAEAAYQNELKSGQSRSIREFVHRLDVGS
jgi:protein tyrosine/serine phosphatase